MNCKGHLLQRHDDSLESNQMIDAVQMKKHENNAVQSISRIMTSDNVNLTQISRIRKDFHIFLPVMMGKNKLCNVNLYLIDWGICILCSAPDPSLSLAWILIDCYTEWRPVSKPTSY